MDTVPSENDRTRGRIWLVGAGLGVILIAVGGWFSASLGEDTSVVTPAVQEERRQPVHAVEVERGTIQSWVFAQGTARSTQRKYLSFERNGEITFIKPGPDGRDLRPGDVVAKGEPLARLDQRQLKSEIKTAQAAVAEAEAQAKASASDVKQAETQYQLALSKNKPNPRQPWECVLQRRTRQLGSGNEECQGRQGSQPIQTGRH